MAIAVVGADSQVVEKQQHKEKRENAKKIHFQTEYWRRHHCLRLTWQKQNTLADPRSSIARIEIHQSVRILKRRAR
jgi:hypothetical protein